MLAALAEIYSVTANFSGPETDLVDVCEWFTSLNSLAFSTGQCWEGASNKVTTAVIATVLVPALRFCAGCRALNTCSEFKCLEKRSLFALA